MRAANATNLDRNPGERSGGICGFSRPRFAKIGPRRVHLFYEPYLLPSSPPFDLLFAIEGVTHVLVAFEPYKTIASVRSSKARGLRISVFRHSTLKAIGHSAIKHMRSTGDDVNVVVVMLPLAHR
jgi:hypothetical protein